MQQNIEDYGTTWYCGKNPQEKAFSEGEKLGHTFYCHIDVSNGTIQSKAFGSYKNITTFWKETKDIPPEEKAIYEIIRDSGPSKFYADLEWSLDWKNKTEILDDFSKIMKECFNQCSEFNFEVSESIILDACNVAKNKGSLHITHPNVYFDNLSSQRRFWSYVRTIMENDYPKLFFQDETECNYITKTFIDFSVYTKNRAFRLPFSSKMKNHILERPLIPDEKVTINTIGDYIISNPPHKDLNYVDVSNLPINTDSLGKKNMVSKKILNNLADKYKVKIGKIKGNLIQLKNVGNRICPINGECNESDNAYFKIKNGFVEYKCFDENCKNKTLCIHKIDDSYELMDNIPFDNYNIVIQEVLDQIKNVYEMKPLQVYDHVKRCYVDSPDAILKHETKFQKCYQNYYTVLTQLLQDMNKYICAITGSSKTYFLIRKVGIDELDNKYIYYVRQLKNSLLDTFQNRFYTDNFTLNKVKKLIPGKQKSWIDLWLKWDKRQQYDAEIFKSPLDNIPISLFNTFHHLNITKNLSIIKADEPGEVSVHKFLNFIKVAWANGDEEIFNWVIDWFAHNIQKPLVKMSSTLVLRGEEGVGKGMVIQKIKQILGSINFCQPTTPNDILGNFNSIVDRKAFLFLDELVWGGDKEKAGILKKIITEKEGTINEKNIPQRQFQNCYNIAIATNEDWAVPAGNNARRFMMIDVINTEENKDINKSDVYNCCPYSLAKFLYNRDISNFRHDKIIVTNALASQKELSAPNSIKFILEDIKNDTFPFDQKIEAISLYERFRSTYTHAKYTTVQSFCKDIKKVINYTIYKPFKGKRLLCIPNKDDCLLTINKYFKQDMFTDDADVVDSTENEADELEQNISNVYEVDAPCINPLL